MITLNKPVYAVYDRAEDMFIYGDLGEVQWSNLPRKSSCRASAAEAEKLLARYVYWATHKRVEQAEKQVKLYENPADWVIGTDPAERRSQEKHRREWSELAKKELAQAKKLVPAALKEVKEFVVVKISVDMP
jgi:hypothetical protein